MNISLSKSTRILIPALSHRFILTFKGFMFTREESDAICTQVIRYTLDIKSKTIKVTVAQPAAMSALMEAIESLIASKKESLSLTIHLSNSEQITQSNSAIILTKLACTGHEFTMDYASTGQALHKLTFSYEELSAEHYGELI